LAKHIEHNAAAKTKMLLSEADAVVDMLGVDDTLLDSLLDRLGLE